MAELQISLACLEAIRQTGSILEKKELLKKFDNVTLRKILQLTYDDKKFGFGPEAKIEFFSKPLGQPWDVPFWWEQVLILLDGGELSATGRGLVDDLAYHSPDGHYLQLLVGILTKDLRLGMRSTTILQVFPHLFEVFNVQLAKPFNQAKLVFPCAVEPKFDGVRAIYLEGRYLSRYGQELQGPEIDCPAGWVLDGELVAGHFQETLSAVRVGGDLKYYVFDTIPQEEWYSRAFKLSNLERNLAAPDEIKGTQGVVRFWCDSLQHLEEVHARNLSLGFEGSMVKANVPYELKRSYSWMKIKPTLDMDVQIIGLEEGVGKFQGTLGALVCVTPEGKEFNMGVGFSDKERDEIWDFATNNHGLFLEITYQELTIDGVPRFARFKRWRPDKS